MSTGPLPENILPELEALKLRLIGMAADELSQEQGAALASEISSIRLQLKRIATEQQVALRALERRALDE